MTVGRQFYAIAPTQFTADGELNASATASNIARAGELGISRFLLAGAYGEFQSLEDDERVRLVETVRSGCPKAVLMVGAVHPSTSATQSLANRLIDVGADEVMVAVPAMSEVSDSEILRHFEHLDTGVVGPLVLYNNPVFGHDIDPIHIARLAGLTSFSAVKQGTSSSRKFIESVAAAHGGSKRLRVLAASDATGVVTIPAGADGLTSTNFWAFPDAVVKLANAAGTADHGLAMRIHLALVPYFELVRSLGQPRAIKAAMLARGFHGTSMVRLPYEPLSPVEQRSLDDVMRLVDLALSDIDSGSGVRAS